MTLESNMITETEAAQRLGVSFHTLRKWRVDKKNITYYKLGYRTVRYKAEDIEELRKKRLPSEKAETICHPDAEIIDPPLPDVFKDDLVGGLVIYASELVMVCQRLLGISKHLNQMADNLPKSEK